MIWRVPDEHFMAAQARMLAGQTELRRDRVRLAEEFFARRSSSIPASFRPTAN